MKKRQNKNSNAISRKAEPRTTEPLVYPVRLNRFIALSGECSRRKADELIADGQVKVNGKRVLEMGFKVEASDLVSVNDRDIKPEAKVYILLNKPKDCICTADDPQGRRTIFDLIKRTGKERLFSVGRLDRLTTGLILLTNDGDLANDLSHPSNEVEKVYHVELNKPLTRLDEEKIEKGIELEEGLLRVDGIGFPTKGNRREVGIEIHIGWNRVVRRMFEALNFEVVRLDRVLYAGLTKIDLPRSKWRYLDEKEVRQLKNSKRVAY